jgi:hypothetical protein
MTQYDCVVTQYDARQAGPFARMLPCIGGPRRSITDSLMNAPPLAYRFGKFCRLAGMGKTKGYEEVAAGRLKVRKRGRSTIVLADEGKEYLQSLPRLEPQSMEQSEEESEDHP